MSSRSNRILPVLTIALLLAMPSFLVQTPTAMAVGVSAPTTLIGTSVSADEGAIDVDPSNPNNVAVFFQGLESCPGYACQHTQFTSDGGATWTAAADLSGSYDPDLSFDTSGNLYRLSGGNRVDKSTDHGATWPTTTHAQTSDGKFLMPDGTRQTPCGYSMDFSKLQIDKGTRSTHADWLFVWPANVLGSFSYSGSGCHLMQSVYYSADGGVSWDGSAWESRDQMSTQFGFSRAGIIYTAAYNDSTPGCGQGGGLEMYWTFGLATWGTYCAFQFAGTGLTGTQFYANAHVLFDPTNSSNVGVGFTAIQNGAKHLFLVKSTDGGSSFASSTLIRVDEQGSVNPGGRGTGGGMEMMPKWTVSSNGRIDAAWYDDINAPTGSAHDIYYAFSVDHGATFAAPYRVTPISDAAYTDYLDMTSFGSKAYLYYPVVTTGHNAAVTTITVTSGITACFTQPSKDYGNLTLSAACSTDSLGTVNSWKWNWGDGTPDTTGTATPMHTYWSPGNYTITLTAGDSNGYQSTAAQVVTIYTPPSPCFGTTSSFVTNLSFTADASCSTDPRGTINSWTWTWGDGSASSTGSPTAHAYRCPGTYSVTLAVQDNIGWKNTTTLPLVVTYPPDPDPSTPNECGSMFWQADAQTGAWNYSKVLVPPGRTAFNASVAMLQAGVTGLDLYVRRGARPTETSYDCKVSITQNDSLPLGCGVASPASDWYYIGGHVVNGTPQPSPNTLVQDSYKPKY